MKTCVKSEEAVPPLPQFSHATISNGTVYVSGSIGSDKDWNLAGDIKAQTRAGIQNMEKILQAAGSGLDRVLKCTVFLTNLKEDFKPMNEVYSEFFHTNPPARTCIGVAQLPMGAAFEIECIAEVS
ncbi:Endoribonuclease L-PSP [Wolfiporia cocos MD-104 SS10]|uniref:Endoribonuclease L-PSP n=1 Tax=Wolfiporia cocos (strain MD-104) TaxID=742152 RepID=A0A2H3JN98_WOLCO|nr:Endoribonuclease L-PSP [Wolfiporia cocos MD-104 SS10]